MSRGEIMDWLTACAKHYAPQAKESIVRNAHMNDRTAPPSQAQIDAVIADFANYCAMTQCMDLGLYAKDL